MKTWLITGCSSGIGRGIAKAVLKKGDNAVVTARDTSKIADLVDQYPNTALGVALDITKKESISAVSYTHLILYWERKIIYMITYFATIILYSLNITLSQSFFIKLIADSSIFH